MVNHELFRKVAARHAQTMEGSGMTESDAMRIFSESSVESIAVVRDWYLLYIPFDDDVDVETLKPFRLTALEILADKKNRFDGSGRLVTSYVKHFLDSHTLITKNTTYLLVGKGPSSLITKSSPGVCSWIASSGVFIALGIFLESSRAGIFHYKFRAG